MTEQRINSAIEVIEYAMKHGISVKEASVKCGYADTYVKNVKRGVQQKFDAGTLEDEQYDKFMSVYEKYETAKKLSNDDEDVDIKQPVEGEKVSVSQNGDNLEIDWKNGNPFPYATSASTTTNSFGEYNVDIDVDGDTEEETPKFSEGVYPVNHIKSLDDLIRECNVNLDEWRVVRHIVNKWDVTSWKRGYPETWENFQVKASLEKIKEVHQAKQLHEIFSDLIKDYKPPVVTAKYAPKSSALRNENNLLEVTLFDLHIGKLGWAGEVGENYDTKIAYARFIDAINNLLQRAQGFEFSRIVFPIGNDFFNSDNMNNTTTAGTPQDEDLRWQKTFKLGCELLIHAIGILKTAGVPVDILLIPGNHDWERNYYLGTVLEAWFRNDDQVNIDNGANPRKYYSFGDVLLGYTHGKEEKEMSLPMLMAIEKPELWGQSKFREWHLGHFHKKKNMNYTVLDKTRTLNEENGVIVRYLSSLSGTEEWHFKKGYVGSHKAGEAFIWNDKSGMVAHLNFNFTDFDREL